MTDEADPNDWYFRADGAITTSARDVQDVGPMRLHNAYLKTWRGEELTDDERAAVEAAKALPLSGSVAGNMLGDTALGFLAAQAPMLLHELDALVEKMAERLGGPRFLAWEVASDYAARALMVTQDEYGIGALAGDGYEAGGDLARFSLPPERVAEIVAERADAEASNAAWEGSPEQLARLAAMAPDDGPEGWSQVPPMNPEHPCHPAQRASQRD